ncbi:deoxyribodipyrimidine photo-lyase [Phragmitibacter flavus]|uniref:Deoxyribodipyrimidine photo-lyase n=1 Tax=Phragmitibacter flavus TaxID=2576071 RepID=A0A5R8KA68_9BACT|nr:deoxyribodipyrimidine photo-lyase [Phragmitibacter flavus]TLD69196.1 deoxyribodipyrimidine photo-lyase [Phragmitibacter flavus]
MKKYKTSLHWFRRDLRLVDNAGLWNAQQMSEQVVPVYVLSDWKKKHDWTGPNRQAFLCGNLQSLAKNLEAIGSRLVLRCGSAERELEKLLKETKAEALFVNRDPDPFGKEVEGKVKEVCERMGVAFHSFKDAVLHEADEVVKGDGSAYRVYTPYSKVWLGLAKPEPLPRVKSLGNAVGDNVKSEALPTLAHWGLEESGAELPEAGERAARERMKNFVGSRRLPEYAEKRNVPFGMHSSGLSPDLRYGLIGIRELYARCRKKAEEMSTGERKGVETYVKELGWREFYMAVLHFWPEVLETDFNPEFRNVRWDSDEALFEAWKAGMTGFPMVDAGMRQLLATGWMHNRLRMIVAMFLTKDLHCHWRLGESFFMQQLIDGEIASNNGGWQWSAGTGADAAPYFRIQNPWLQGKRFDPDGMYIKKWIPELKDVPVERLHEPAKLRLAKDYPLPIVDHHAERDKTLERFKQGKEKR